MEKRQDFGVIWSESINFDYLRHQAKFWTVLLSKISYPAVQLLQQLKSEVYQQSKLVVNALVVSAAHRSLFSQYPLINYSGFYFFRLDSKHIFDCFLEVAKPVDEDSDAFILQSYPSNYKEKDGDKFKVVPKFTFPCKLEV